MNAFRYSSNEEAPKPLMVPMIAVVIGSDNARNNRVGKLADVLEANGRTFVDYSKILK